MQAARGTPLNSSADSPGPFPRESQPVKRWLFLAMATVGYAVDVWSKSWAVRHLGGGEERPVLGDLLILRLVRNPGAAFSTGTQFTLGLSVLAVVAACVVAYFGWRVRNWLWALGLGLLFAGILGNLTDRIFRAPGPFRGHVVDFFQLPHWPVFNVADMLINAAAALILLQSFRGHRVDGTIDRERGDLS